jgi:peptidyl-prolyl cis-trans isomerase D
MSEFIHNKTSSLFVTILIGIIVLSFMFTGYQAFENSTGGGQSSIGKVGDYPIKPEEYQQEYNRQIEFFKQMFGGEISAKQIENMKIKESTIRNIVQRKLMLKLANEVGTFPSEEEVKTEIKNLPYFKTDDKFDITRYKALLAANHLTPQEFEQDVINQMKMKNVHDLNPKFPISEAYLSDLQKFKEDKLDVEVISFSKDSIRKNIPVSKEELAKFLTVDTNKKRLESVFGERKASLDKAEEVTARHILLKTDGKNEADVKAQIEKIAKEVNAANFSKMADKYTEDPSGKGKGGSLGSFGKGAMVPEFENIAFNQKVGSVSAPVITQFGYHLILTEKKTPAVIAKLSDYQDKFATELIQKEKTEEVKKLTVDLSNQLKKALEANSDKEVKSLVEKYSLTSKKGDVNRIDGLSTGSNLSTEAMKQIFSSDMTKTNVHLFDEGNTINMIKTYPKKSVSAAPTMNDQAKIAQDNSSLKNVLSKKMMEGILKKLEADTKVKINSNFMQD